jgi:Big-like domain-containing protein
MARSLISHVALALLTLSACSLGSDASDGSSPLVSIDFPASNSVVSGQVAIAVTAIDDFGVDQVRILIDDVERIKQFTAPFGYLWNTAQLPDNSTHVIRVEAKDVAGNTGIKSITVTVQNGPQ